MIPRQRIATLRRGPRVFSWLTMVIIAVLVAASCSADPSTLDTVEGPGASTSAPVELVAPAPRANAKALSELSSGGIWEPASNLSPTGAGGEIFGFPDETLAMADDGLNAAALWDRWVERRYATLENPRTPIANFAVAADGWCWDLLDATALEQMFRKDPVVVESISTINDTACDAQVPVVGGTPPTRQDDWNGMLDERFGRTVSWNDRDGFGERAEQFCADESAPVDVVLDVELSMSAQLELVGLIDNGECRLLDR